MNSDRVSQPIQKRSQPIDAAQMLGSCIPKVSTFEEDSCQCTSEHATSLAADIKVYHTLNEHRKITSSEPIRKVPPCMFSLLSNKMYLDKTNSRVSYELVLLRTETFNCRDSYICTCTST